MPLRIYGSASRLSRNAEKLAGNPMHFSPLSVTPGAIGLRESPDESGRGDRGGDARFTCPSLGERGVVKTSCHDVTAYYYISYGCQGGRARGHLSRSREKGTERTMTGTSMRPAPKDPSEVGGITLTESSKHKVTLRRRLWLLATIWKASPVRPTRRRPRRQSP